MNVKSCCRINGGFDVFVEYMIIFFYCCSFKCDSCIILILIELVFSKCLVGEWFIMREGR